MSNDINLIDKIINKEINVNDLSQEEITRLTQMCEKQIENLNKRVSDKEEKIEYLEGKIAEYKKIVSEE